jgi:hypothetical protein
MPPFGSFICGLHSQVAYITSLDAVMVVLHGYHMYITNTMISSSTRQYGYFFTFFPYMYLYFKLDVYDLL